MKLIKFSTPINKGVIQPPVWINPQFVTSITSVTDEQGKEMTNMVCIVVGGERYFTPGKINDVANRINEELEFASVPGLKKPEQLYNT